jgi:coenzyme PQQ synthesis protein D (PqqD)
MSTGPSARSADLIVDGIGDELLVYDTTTNRAHALNSDAAAVWKACNGTRSAEEIAAATGLSPAAVELALDNLLDIDLITDHARTGISRRAALRRITLTTAGLAVALPVIRSITAPTAAMAYAACATPHENVSHSCTSDGPCCASSYCSASGQCFPGTAHPNAGACENNISCAYGSRCLANECTKV